MLIINLSYIKDLNHSIAFKQNFNIFVYIISGKKGQVFIFLFLDSFEGNIILIIPGYKRLNINN